MARPQRDIPPGRKALHYVGMALALIGVLLFVSVFFTGFGHRPGSIDVDGIGDISGVRPLDDRPLLRPFIGMGLVVLGGILMKLGAAGLAGSGMVLDPQRSRRDLEPWSRMAGGHGAGRIGGGPGVQAAGGCSARAGREDPLPSLRRPLRRDREVLSALRRGALTVPCPRAS